MEPIADITGFDVEIEGDPTSTTVMIRVAGGTIHWPPGMERWVHACSVSVEKTGRARRVRVFLRESRHSMFEAGRRYGADIDGEQVMARGYYSNGLVVVGHVEIPAQLSARAVHARHAANERHARETKLTHARTQAEMLFRDWATTHASAELRQLRTNEEFAGECVRRWPVLKRSTLTRKWIPTWRKAETAQLPAPVDAAVWRGRVTGK